MEDYTRKLFQRGTEIAAKRGLILVDTKYEFGKTEKVKLYLLTKFIHQIPLVIFMLMVINKDKTKGEPQKQLSKEFVRQWLIENGFQGKEGDLNSYNV